MPNPWMKKNPLMSMWLGGANALASRARGPATAAAKRLAGARSKDAARIWAQAWMAMFTSRRPR